MRFHKRVGLRCSSWFEGEIGVKRGEEGVMKRKIQILLGSRNV